MTAKEPWASLDLGGRLLYRDANMAVLDKPAGLAVHGGPRTPFHLELLLPGLGLLRGQPMRPAHRLDRDTAGCLVLARHDKAATRLGRLFSAGRVEKTYWAIVAGEPGSESGRVEMPLFKRNTPSGWRMEPAKGGQAAITDWRVMGRADGLAWLELSPHTGRTHQIRVHCASGLGCPILGDPVYGQAGPAMHLLSRRIAVPYWADRPAVVAEAGAPGHMLPLLERMGRP